MCCVQAAASGWGADFLKKNQESVAKANAAVAAAIEESDSAAKGEHLCMNCTFLAQISPYRGQPSRSAVFGNIMCCWNPAAAAVKFDIRLQHDLGSVCCPAAAPDSALWTFGKPASESQSASASSGKSCPLQGSCVVMPRMGDPIFLLMAQDPTSPERLEETYSNFDDNALRHADAHTL
jgi:hypothetical protein